MSSKCRAAVFFALTLVAVLATVTLVYAEAQGSACLRMRRNGSASVMNAIRRILPHIPGRAMAGPDQCGQSVQQHKEMKLRLAA